MNDATATANAAKKAANIKLMVFDVDGIMTDGTLWFNESGEAFKRFHALDGHGIKLLHEAGIATAIISGRQSAAVTRRAAELNIRYVHQAIADKLPCFDALLASVGLQRGQAGFMGDDVIDLGIMTRCGFAASVTEASLAVRSRADWVASRPAGAGAVRELTDFLLQAQGKYDAMIAVCIGEDRPARVKDAAA